MAPVATGVKRWLFACQSCDGLGCQRPLPPVARHYVIYDEGTPQRELQDIVAATFASAEVFFGRLSRDLGIEQDSASGTYYGFLRADRSLPASHRAAYLDLLPIETTLLERIAAEREIKTRPGSARLAELERDLLLTRGAVQALLDVARELLGSVQELGGEVPPSAIDALQRAVARMQPADQQP